MNVTLSQLRAFERIVRLGSFHAAARDLHLSQPSVSQRIPNNPMHAIIQVETKTDGPAPTDQAAGSVHIAWLAVFTPSCNRAMSVVPAAAACTG